MPDSWLDAASARLGGRAGVTALVAASVGATCAIVVAALVRGRRAGAPAAGAVICAIGTAVPPNAGDNVQFREVVSSERAGGR